MTEEEKKVYYDEFGEPVKDELVSKVELDKIREEAETKEKELTDKKDEELKDIKEKLLKLENKDFNFKKLRDMTKEDQEKLTTREVELLKRQESLEENQTNFIKSQKDSWMSEAIKQYTGGDEEKEKKIKYQVSRLNDDATTKEDIINKVKDAVGLAGLNNPGQSNPITEANAYYGSINNAKPRTDNFAESDRGEEAARKLGLGFIKAKDAKRKEE